MLPTGPVPLARHHVPLARTFAPLARRHGPLARRFVPLGLAVVLWAGVAATPAVAGTGSDPAAEVDPATEVDPASEVDPVIGVGPTDEVDPVAEPATNGSITILIAGDIAGCAWNADAATARLVARRKGLVMTSGDNVYQLGTRRELRDCYAPTWGRFKKRTRPVPGNHEYATPGAAAYFDYFGRRAGPAGRGYYAFDAGAWRIYALDTNCSASRGGCRPGSPQHRWLQQDLEEHATACVMAVAHHPHFSSGRHGNSRRPRPFVTLLYEAGAEIIVNGHDHIYERFAPARPWGRVDPEHGIRQFIVGTGGAPLYPYKEDRPPHSRERTNRTYGVLRLGLEPDGYSWRFLPTRRGVFSDRGRGTCHEPPAQVDRVDAEPAGPSIEGNGWYGDAVAAGPSAQYRSTIGGR